MKDKNPIDELFRKGVEDHTIQPGASAWEKVAQGLEQKGGRNKGIYILRAAAVALLVGLSSLMYFESNSGKLTKVEPVSTPVVVNDDPKNNSTNENPPSEPVKEKENTQEKSTPKKENKKAIEPIMKSAGGPGQIIVNAEIPVDEEELHAEEELTTEIALETKKVSAKPRIKLKYTVPVTERSFYANQENEGENLKKENNLKFREKLFAYANDQIGNLMKGESLELPKTEQKGKPQLEINLGKILK